MDMIDGMMGPRMRKPSRSAYRPLGGVRYPLKASGQRLINGR